MAPVRGSAIVNPAKLCWGLADAAERLGVRIHERTAVLHAAQRQSPALQTNGRPVRCPPRPLLATSAFPGLLGEIRRRVIPVWDYVLVTEPLSAEPQARDRLAQPARASATWPTASTTTG